jgi:hypothetical protein
MEKKEKSLVIGLLDYSITKVQATPFHIKFCSEDKLVCFSTPTPA